ncbi:MAG: hypothetical protein EA341_13010 [Mongoliibacter sp.]|uniref:hypothetical protein n=1 Tax=Mongoliibacter sp. TaxID=2022438 RepID=UPI0012EF66C4|nr:hypothetical protein [Mongoliibacter sp.]TVP47131.1 MAG: hypothetical protein EA341_13010 [Mongoliibacter sp.]
MALNKIFTSLYQKLLSDKTKKKGERVILIIAIASFIIHLMVIFLVDLEVIFLGGSAELLQNPIAAIYTPFSFILVYEVYLLVYYLPKSFTNYISKQYEIITLIIIRRLFKDLSNLTLTTDWFSLKNDLQFTYDIITSLLLFFLIFQFLAKSKKSYLSKPNNEYADDANISRFIKIKKVLATSLIPILFIVALYSLSSWSIGVLQVENNSEDLIDNINNIFFEQFFTVLIIADVILLLFSFFYTDEFHKVIRNSGFIISTILIRLSFSVDGLLNNLLIVSAIIFGLLILLIHNKFEEQIDLENSSEEKTD